MQLLIIKLAKKNLILTKMQKITSKASLTKLFLMQQCYLLILQLNPKTMKAKKIQKTLKCVQVFLNQTYKNYQSMKNKIKKIWCAIMAAPILITGLTACNVTRVVTNESQYFQRGDTAVVIQTKTTETYNAEKH